MANLLPELRAASRNPLHRRGLRPVPVLPADHLGSGRLVEIAGGRVYVETLGSGPPVVALPGFAGSSLSWRRLAENLKEHFTFHLFDFLGHGLSDKPSGADHSPTGQARQIESLTEALRIDRCVLFSNSASAQTAIHALFRRPRGYLACVMVAPFVAPGAIVGLAARFAAARPAKYVMAGLFGMRAFVSLANRMGRQGWSKAPDNVIDEQYLPFGTPGYWDSLAASARFLRPRALSGIMQMIATPTLVIWGDGDRAGSLEGTRRVLSNLPDCRFVTIERCGHVVQEEKPEELSQAILRLYEELAARLPVKSETAGSAQTAAGD